MNRTCDYYRSGSGMTFKARFRYRKICQGAISLIILCIIMGALKMQEWKKQEWKNQE